MDRKNKAFFCLCNDCNNEFKILLGCSKHQRICEKEVAEKNKGCLLIEGENNVKCKEYNKVISLVANWYQYHRSTHKKKNEKTKKI